MKAPSAVGIFRIERPCLVYKRAGSREDAVIPIGALLLLAFVLLILLRPKHILVWVLLPFLIVHSILPVKELRFLFPLAPLMPWLLITAWEALHERWPRTMARTFWMQLLFPFAAVNALALLIGTSTPAGNGRIKLAQAIQAEYGERSVHIDQLGDWRQWIPSFFLSQNSTQQLANKVVVDPKKNGPIHLVIAKRSLGLDRVSNLQRIAIATPPWTDRLLGWYRFEDVHDPLVLYMVTTRHIGH